MDNVFELFRSRFPKDRSRPFIETGGGRVYTYAEMEDASGRIARLLANLGVSPGTRVAVQVDKSPETVFLYLACLRVGAVFLPLNTAYKGRELEYFFGDAEPRVVVCWPEAEAGLRAIAGRAAVAHLFTLDGAGGGTLMDRCAGLSGDFPTAARAVDDVAAILYTSGTTGVSKGAMLSHGNLGANALALHRAWGWEPDDVLLHALPIYHTHGLFMAIHCVLLNGTGMLFMPRFDVAEVMRLLPRATVFMGVPTHYVRLLGDPGFRANGRALCRDMRLFISGSAPLLGETFHAFRTLTGHTILERYGMTETGMNTSNPLPGERRAGTVGFPLPGVEVRVAGADGRVLRPGAVGVLELRGPNVFSGYWGMPEKTAEAFREDGFFITGDLARIDGDGYVHIVGRAKDMVITGGLNVYPKEVETCIDEIEGVVESAVIGVPHPDFGEAVTAVVVRRPGCAAPTAAAVTAAVKDRLANFKVPKAVHFIDELPRNATGKVQKNVLRRRYGKTPVPAE